MTPKDKRKQPTLGHKAGSMVVVSVLTSTGWQEALA